MSVVILILMYVIVCIVLIKSLVKKIKKKLTSVRNILFDLAFFSVTFPPSLIFIDKQNIANMPISLVLALVPITTLMYLSITTSIAKKTVKSTIKKI